MRYSHHDLVPLFPPLFETATDGDVVVSASHNCHEETGIVVMASSTLVSPITMTFASDATPYRVLAPNTPKNRKPREDDWEESRAWSDVLVTRVAGLGSSRVSRWENTYKRLIKPKPVSDDAVPVDPLALADAFAFVGEMAGGASVRLDAQSAFVRRYGTARLWSFEAPLPIGSDVLAVAPAAANWFAGAVRLFTEREGHVEVTVGNVGTRTVPLWRFVARALSGAQVVLDATSATTEVVDADPAGLLSACATRSKAFASVRLSSWPERFMGSDLRDITVDDGGLYLADPSKTAGKARPVPVEATMGWGTTCVPYPVLREALRAAGAVASLFIGKQTDPLLVSSRDGRTHTVIVPWVPVALWPR